MATLDSMTAPTRNEIETFCNRCEHVKSDGSCDVENSQVYLSFDIFLKIDKCTDGITKSTTEEGNSSMNPCEYMSEQEQKVAKGTCFRARVNGKRGSMQRDGFHIYQDELLRN